MGNVGSKRRNPVKLQRLGEAQSTSQ